MDETEKYVSVSEAASMIGLHAETIRRYIRSGEIEAIQVVGKGRGGKYMISLTILEDFKVRKGLDKINPKSKEEKNNG